MGKVAEGVVDHAEKAKHALDIAPSETPWEPIPEDWTDEQRIEHIKAEKAKHHENLKKAKKKPKTDEEDAKDAEDVVTRTTSALVSQLTDEDTD